jgi:hypothetical protein
MVKSVFFPTGFFSGQRAGNRSRAAAYVPVILSVIERRVVRPGELS